MEPLPKTYDPKEIDQKWYPFWENQGLFRPNGDKADPFVIVIPPPNITGAIHIGHGFNLTLQDIATRFHRMRGQETLWLPGEDHAGIATQNVVEKMLIDQGTSREEIGRESFLKITWEWARKYRKTITEQIRAIGCSVDWDRDRFTLDEGLNRAVRKVFVQLYQRGLIYRGKYIVNWCSRCQTALSDEEVEYVEEKTHLWVIRYPLANGEGFMDIATTRPETMLGDTAVAVYPSDNRYVEWIGKRLRLPLMNRQIPVIADRFVDMDFGTGVVKVTPAHDPNDYQIGLRHQLDMISILDEKGITNENAGPYQSMTVLEARKAVVKDLEAQGFLMETRSHIHSVGQCHRCNATIEPRLSDQWFVKMKPLTHKAVSVVENGEIQFFPERWKKTYFQWMDEIRDWCISRQLWWGHRIPVWYCDQCGRINVQEEDVEVCEHCGSNHLTQDEDVLDTWFSSALWPFSTLGWPEETFDLSKYYPTSLLSTGFDIIFFWVARMIVMGMEFMGKIPFREVYIHQLIRDKKGRKMSKSLGNGIDPLEVIDQYGADAMRFTMTSLAVQGRDIKLDVRTFEHSKHFVNKIWNAARFCLMHLGALPPQEYPQDWHDHEELTIADQWILMRMDQAINEIDQRLLTHEYNQASKVLYEFFWNAFCDWYIECVKPILNELQTENTINQNQQSTRKVLLYVLDRSLRLLHPFMPFVTEEIWQKLPRSGKPISIMVDQWPEPGNYGFDESLNGFERLVAIVRGIRNVRLDFDIPARKKMKAFVRFFSCAQSGEKEIFGQGALYLANLAYLDKVLSVDAKPEKSARVYTDGSVEVYLEIGEEIDWDSERQRLQKEIQKAHEDILHLQKKMENPKFLERAAEDVVEETKEKWDAAQTRFAHLTRLLQDLE